MPTYMLRQQPSRPKTQVDENPIQEIADNIRNGNRAITAWGGWSIGTCWKKIHPGDRLLFYRTEEPTGFFAVGRALPADDSECCKLREEGLRKRFPNIPGIDKLGKLDDSGLAAFTAANWETGEGEMHYIHAEWDVVANPNMVGHVLVRHRLKGRKASGYPFPDESEADAICAKCMNAPNALHAK